MKIELNNSSLDRPKHLEILAEEQRETFEASPDAGNSSVAYFIGTSSKAKLSIPLSFPREVAAQLEEKGMAVIYGAPASGKSEQMDLVLPASQRAVFDLSLRFAEAYSAATGRDINEILREYTSNGSQEQKALKAAQKEWLSKPETLVKELASWPQDVIIFDEFDFAGDLYLSADEADAAVSIVHIGESVKRLGKQVVFIIHSTAYQCDPFWQAMQRDFQYESKEAVTTRFFTKEEEIYLLSQTSLSFREKQEFMTFAQGSPTAYLPILQNKPDLNLQFLKDRALLISSFVIKFTKQTIRPDVWDLLVDIAKGKESLEKITDPALIGFLLASGFVGQNEDHLVMADFAKNAVMTYPV